ncbi:Rossmann-like and DUF2520 domain-containing protein [Candidatus Latescibacterota bacterium]
MKSEKPRCQLLGAGRAGTVLSIALSQAGYRFTWIGSNKREDAGKLAHKLGIGGYGLGFEGFGETADFLILAVPDDKIRCAASDAVQAGIISDDTVVAHLSGALESEILEEAKEAGASVMAFHPAQTFTMSSNPATVLKKICFDMEGDDTACSLGESIATDLGAVSIRLDPAHRIFSHLAMTAASNYTVSLMRIAEDIMAVAGIPNDKAGMMLHPLFSATANNISSIGTTGSLTGPVSRGDTDVLSKHFKALEDMDGNYRAVFANLAEIALKITIERGDISAEKAEEIKKIISGR